MRSGASSNTHCLKDTPVPRRRIGEDKDVGVDHLERAQEFNENVVLLLVSESLDGMAYVKLGAK